MSDVIIYTLKDPITNDIRYIGKTTQTLSRRLNGHINRSRKSTTSHNKAWIKGLLNKDLKPIIETFDVVPTRFTKENKPHNISSVLKCDIDGNIVEIFDSYVSAGKSIGVFHSSISYAIKKGKLYKGFIWKKKVNI